jgi:hypothetical protein
MLYKRNSSQHTATHKVMYEVNNELTATIFLTP